MSILNICQSKSIPQFAYRSIFLILVLVLGCNSIANSTTRSSLGKGSVASSYFSEFQNSSHLSDPNFQGRSSSSGFAEDIFEGMWADFSDNPFLYPGDTETFAATLSSQTMQGWQILKPDNSVLASSTNANGWTVYTSVFPSYQVTVQAPSNAAVAVGLTAQAEAPIGIPGARPYCYVVFDVKDPGTAPPSPPQNLTAQAMNQKIRLNWDTSQLATSYNIRRSLTSGSGHVTIANVSTNTFLDTGLTNGTTYFYKVTAVGLAGESGSSNEASAIPAALGGPLDIPINPANGILPNPLALPDWMDHLIPLSTSDAPAGGSASGTAISLPYGVVIQNNGIDIVGDNPLGSDAPFSRTYRSTLAVANISSPGLPRGWVHNWDYRIVSTNNDEWVPLYLIYPNGATDILTPQMENSETETIDFTVPMGCPYKVQGVLDPNNEGEWLSITIIGNGSVRKKFQRPSGENIYRLKEMTESNGSKITLDYSSGKLIDIDSTKANYSSANLLHLSYTETGGFLSQVHANNDFSVFYDYSGGQLTGVESKTNSGDMWGYSYTDIEGSPFLSSVSTLGPYGNPKTTTITHDSETGRASSYTDSNGVTKSIDYLTAQAYETSSYPSLPSKTTSTKFDNKGRLTEFTDVAGYTTQVQYNSSHPASISQVNMPLSGSSGGRGQMTAQYDSHGNMTQFTGTDWTYSQATYAYPVDSPHGRVTEVVARDSNGAAKETTTYSYYSTTNAGTGALAGELQSVTTNGVTITYTYTMLGNIKTISGPGADGSTATTTFDHLASGAGANTEKLGIVYKVTDPIGRETTYGYDSFGRMDRTTDPIGRVTNYSFNNNYNQLSSIESIGRGIIFEHAIGGKPASAVLYDSDTNSPAGALTVHQSTFDNEYDPNAVQSLNKILTFTKGLNYDLNGVTNGNNVKMHEFIDNPSLKKVTTKIGVGTRGTVWETNYDNYGHVDTVNSAMTQADFTFDSQDGLPIQMNSYNLLTTSGPADETHKDYTYDAAARLETASRNTFSYGPMESSYIYDNNNYVQQELFEGANAHFESKIQYARNTLGFVTSMKVDASTDPIQMEYLYTYNAIGWVTQIQCKRGGSLMSDFKATYTYDDAGRIIAVRTPIHTTLYEYNELDEIIKLQNLSADDDVDPAVSNTFKVQDPLNGSWHTIFSQFDDITYNSFGLRTGMDYVMRTQNSPVAFESGEINFGYSNHRLTLESYTRTGKANINYSHSYDSVDNLSALRGMTINIHNNSDQITSIPSVSPGGIPTYDPNGGMTSLGSKSYVFDSTQMLTTMTTTYSAGGGGGPGNNDSLEHEVEPVPVSATIQYLYDHNDLRRARTENDGTAYTYGYAGSSLIWQNKVGSGIVHYLWGPTGPVLEYSTQLNITLAFTYDPQGSLVSRIHKFSYGYGLHGRPYDGARLYDAYGKELWPVAGMSDEETSYVPFRWKGQAGYISDYQTGLVYCWHRYYDPNIGRWLSRDPIGFEGGVNTYSYCGGNPIVFVDPSGLDAIDEIANFFGGWGDTLTFGGTSIIRRVIIKSMFGVDTDGVNTESISYWSGVGVGTVHAAMIGNEFAVSRSAALSVNSLSKAQQLRFNTLVGKAGESLLKDIVGGGQAQVVRFVAGKKRIIDLLHKGIMYESKVGYVSLTDDVLRQIKMDAALIKNGRAGNINGAVWHFFRSPQTGKVGASKNVLRHLKQNGIKYVIHD